MARRSAKLFLLTVSVVIASISYYFLRPLIFLALDGSSFSQVYKPSDAELKLMGVDHVVVPDGNFRQ
jgi:hypothetical protein